MQYYTFLLLCEHVETTDEISQFIDTEGQGTNSVDSGGGVGGFVAT